MSEERKPNVWPMGKALGEPQALRPLMETHHYQADGKGESVPFPKSQEKTTTGPNVMSEEVSSHRRLSSKCSYDPSSS